MKCLSFCCAVLLLSCSCKQQEPQQVYDRVEAAADALVLAFEIGLPALSARDPEAASQLLEEAAFSLARAQKVKLAWADAVDGHGDISQTSISVVQSARELHDLASRYGFTRNTARDLEIREALSGLSVVILTACAPQPGTTGPLLVRREQRDYAAWRDKVKALMGVDE